uniref:Putative secreted protein n=1 Tax=Ixodes ricinus TaxID=34613 RepID=A0A6B0U4N5_IXORI
MDRLRGGITGTRLLWSTSVLSLASASSDPVKVASERFSSSSSSSKSTSSSGDSEPDEERPAADGPLPPPPLTRLLRSPEHWCDRLGNCDLLG